MHAHTHKNSRVTNTRDRLFFYFASNDTQSRVKALEFAKSTRDCVYLKCLFSHRKGFTRDCVSFKDKSTKRVIACRLKTILHANFCECTSAY